MNEAGKPERPTIEKLITTKHITVTEKGPNRTRYTQTVKSIDPETGRATFQFRRGSRVKR